jgi:hypothetical protein
VRSGRVAHFLLAVLLWGSAAFLVAPATVARAAEPAASCTSSVGPGIPPPMSLPSGIPGFHAAWYGQSGYPTLCPGERSTAVVAYYNSGSAGWVRGRMGEMAFLGTSDPSPGQDQVSALGGDGQLGSPATGWPRYNRVAAQPADYVGPGQVAWFQFTIQAPQTPGTYKLYIRPLIEGATWMEDYGVFWQVAVKDADAVGSIAVAPTAAGNTEVGATRTYTATVSGTPGCVDLAFIDDASYPATTGGGLADADGNGRAGLSTAAVLTLVNGAAKGTSFVDCVSVPFDGIVTFVVSSTTPNSNVRPVVFRDANDNNALDVVSFVPSEPFGLGGAVLFLPPEATTGAHNPTVLALSTTDNYFTDAGATATYRYDTNDIFQRSGVRLGIDQFEQLITRGDTLAVDYQADETISSVFNITNDVGREAPNVNATVDSWDGGLTQNDVGLRITEPATNVDGIAYSIQRSTTGGVSVCGPGTGAYADLALTQIASGTNSTTYIDPNLAVGAYCYRVGATDPVTGVGAFGYSQGAIINNPPLPIAPPRSLDARLTTSAGSPALLDNGDVIKIAFSKEMQAPVGRQMRVQDADGTIADIGCRQSEQACTLNAATETLGGVSYPANTVITIAMQTPPVIVAAGSGAGLQLNVTVMSGNFADIAGNTWDVPGSDDTVIGAPD